MEPYLNSSRTSGVIAYEIGSDFIRIQFGDSATYCYPEKRIGTVNFERMKQFARDGRGLATFINQHEEVRTGFVRE